MYLQNQCDVTGLIGGTHIAEHGSVSSFVSVPAVATTGISLRRLFCHLLCPQ